MTINNKSHNTIFKVKKLHGYPHMKLWTDIYS
jgi:hypothetical protein